MDRRLVVIVFLLITLFIGFGLIIPVMPVLVQETGAEFHLGMLLALYSAVSFFASPIWGRVSDRIGRRPVILVGLLGFAFSFLLFGLFADSLVMIYVSRLLGGLFSGAATSCAMAYIADITSEEDRTKGMAFAGMAIGFGFIIGPAFGGLLSFWGHTLPFFAAAVLSLVIFAFAYKALRESLTEEERQRLAAQPRVSRWAAFSGSLKFLYVLSFVGTFTLAGLESVLQYFQMAKIGATPMDIGWMLATAGLVGALVQGGIVRRIKPGKEAMAMTVGLLISALGLFLLLFSSNFWNATLFLALFGAGNAFIRPCVTSLVTRKSGVGHGVATGLLSSMDSFGRMTGPLFTIFLFGVGLSLPFLTGAVISLLAIGLIVFYQAEGRRGGDVHSTSQE